MKTLCGINVLIVKEDGNKKFPESKDEKNVDDTKKKPEPFSTHLHNEVTRVIVKCSC